MPSWDDELCNARHDDVTSIVCHRPMGHRGEHEGLSVVTWERDETDDDCPVEAVFPDGTVPCTLTRDHAGPHSYGDTLIPFEGGDHDAA